MANSLLTPTAITREALDILHQRLNFVSTITRDYDDSFAREGAKIGNTLRIRLPNEYEVGDGAVINAQDTREQSVTLEVTSQKHVAMNFTSADLTMSLDNFSERIIQPAMARLASAIEADVLSNVYKDVFNQVNNQGAAATFGKAMDARKMLVDNLAPEDDRYVCMNTQDNRDLVDGLKGQFNQQSIIAKQNREGYLGRTAGFDWMENTLLPSHTRGGANTSYTTDTRTSALATDGTAYSQITVASGSGTIVKGDVFTIANAFRVHPESKISTGVLQQFVCTEDYAGGGGTVKISPSIILGGANQTVAIPSTSATAGLTFAGTASTAHGISLAYQKGAFAFATADLVLPKGCDMAERRVYDGISLRLIRDYDPVNDKLVTRVDVLYGYKTLRPQLAARLANN